MARLIAVRVGSRGRNPVLGVDEPNALNTGLLTSPASLTTVSGLTTISTSNQTITDKRYQDRVVMATNVHDVTFSNCMFEGSGTAPGDGSGLVECKAAGIANIVFNDCLFKPRFPHWNWDSALIGHDFTAFRCDMGYCTDIINVFNTNEPNGDWTAQGFPATPKPYASNVIIQQCYLHDLAYWTAASNGVVHPSDIATHNDVIQHQGGLGTQILGNSIRAYYARQYGHWVETSTALAVEDIAEPFTGVALTSLPAGNPWYGGPFQAMPTGGNTIPDNGSGTAATGRYNTGGVGSLAGLMIGDEVGPSGNLVVEDNWLYGGDFCVNGGGSVNRDYATGPAQTYTMTFNRNKFLNDQGQPVRATASNSTQTINFQQGEDSWVGFVTAPTTGGNANLNMNGTAITVRVS